MENKILNFRVPNPENPEKQTPLRGIGVSQIYYNFINSKNGKIFYQTKNPKIAEEFIKFVEKRIIEIRTDDIKIANETIVIKDYVIKIY